MLILNIVPKLLLIFSFTRCVIAADSGDDFSNNLFSDLAPLLSLLGEQVTMQFMSQAMGWADNMILAMAPLGIITIIVSAIRVGGPSWLKALVGRARENLAVVEASLMSSTSKEVCELWNGQAVVRSMGAAPILEYMFLIPDGFRGGGGGQIRVTRPIPLFAAVLTGLLEESPSTIQKRVPPVRKAEEGSAPSNSPSIRMIGTQGRDTDAPNISLNMNNQSGTGGLPWVAALGTILQLGVLVFSGFATYHPRLMFLKDDRPVVPYAYPCTAVGTLLLVSGMMICAHVVDSSTEETKYRAAPGYRIRMVWLQKSGTVSDQVFGSYAIFTKDDSTVFITSKRAGKRGKPTGSTDRVIQGMIDAVTKLLYPSAASRARRQSSQNRTKASAEQGHTAILASKTVLGALLGLCGFIVQFIGLRGMHWSASVAQLGATLVMTGFRAWVRIGLAKPAETRRLAPGFEVDWLVATLGDPDKAPWLATSDREEIHRDWRITSSVIPSTLECYGDRDHEPPESKAHKLMKLRSRFSHGITRHGPASGEAGALARAIEIVMDKLIDPKGGGEFIWTLGAHYAGSVDHTIYFYLFHGKTWSVCLPDIEAALSLWLYSATKQEDGAAGWDGGSSLQLLGPSTRSLRRDLQWWNSRNAPTIMEVELHRDKTVGHGMDGMCPYKISKLSIRSEELVDPDVEELVDPEVPELVAITMVDFAREIPRGWGEATNSRIVGYGITDGDTAQTREDWGDLDLDCKSSLRSDYSVLTDASETGKEERLLATGARSDAATKSLYVQAMFSAFMWAVAKEVAKRQNESITELRIDDTGSVNSRRSFTLWNRRLATMAQEIQNTGFGSLDEIYLSIIPAFSMNKLLPKPAEVVKLARDHAEQLGRMKRWKEAGDVYFWLLQPTNTFPEDGEFYKTAQYDAVDEAGLTPLHVAALAGDKELAEMLIRHHAEKEMKDLRGMTPLHLAAWIGEEAIARLLIASGADIDATDHRGRTPVYAAAEREQKAIASLLLENGANKDAADNEGRTILHLAAANEHEAVVTLLLNNGAEKNAADDKRQTPLHVATATNSEAIVALLLDSGADKEAADDEGQTPLHIAATAVDTTVAELLLDRGADMEARDHEGRTPLHLASPTAGALLIKRGADEHAKDNEGREPVLTDQSQAAQDYQMQLMLLEQQNKKRMLMARRERV